MIDILLYLVIASLTTTILTAATLGVCVAITYIKNEFF